MTTTLRSPAMDSEGRVLLRSMTREELGAWVTEELGEKPFRAGQLWSWLHEKRVATVEEMTNLSKAFRARLEEIARVDSLTLHEMHEASDGTCKITWRIDSGAIIESVWIPTDKRTTLCISSQVGCALNCQFCLTAKMGLREQLNTAHIVDQVVMTRRLLDEKQRLTNVVFMGMGEPLHNPDNVIPATNILVDRDGIDLSTRKVTLSTSGLVPQIRRFAKESRARLAVSLNATTDEVRDWIMPINRKYPLDELLGALREFPLKKGERITFEYVMLDGVNDTDEDVKRLIRIASGLPCKINLIPFNPHPGTEFSSTPMDRIRSIRDRLVSRHINATIRETRGDDSMAACGQLGKPGTKMPRRQVPPPAFRDRVQLDPSFSKTP